MPKAKNTTLRLDSETGKIRPHEAQQGWLCGTKKSDRGNPNSIAAIVAESSDSTGKVFVGETASYLVEASCRS